MKLGILGGTFNPIHLAHLRIAEAARESAELDQVLFIPAMDPPHKPVDGAIPFQQRLAMVALAIADNPGFGISDIEARRVGKSYTVETLTALRQQRADDALHFIIGSDSFLELGLWHRYAELFALASLVVVARPGSLVTDPIQQLPEPVQPSFSQEGPRRLRHSSGNTIQFVEDSRLEISSSHLRSLVAAGRSLRYLVPSAVENYIAQKGLYRT
jgi:nicotinate-nucleotide adenylyltransferase